jgi:hypothetical protein
MKGIIFKMEDFYDTFLFEAQSRVENDAEIEALYERDLALSIMPNIDSQIDAEREMRAIDEFLKCLSKEGREYCSYRLTCRAYSRRTAYTAHKSVEQQRHIRHALLLVGSLLAKGEAHSLIVDTAEDLQIVKVATLDPYEAGPLRRRRRKAKHLDSRDDLAGRLLDNLSLAYRQSARRRNEKKRILSIAATEITYSEGRRLFGCGPGQFSDAKKHSIKYGAYADVRPSSPSHDTSLIQDFVKRASGLDVDTAWQEFVFLHPDVAERVPSDQFFSHFQAAQSESSENSVEDMILETALSPIHYDDSENLPQLLDSD